MHPSDQINVTSSSSTTPFPVRPHVHGCNKSTHCSPPVLSSRRRASKTPPIHVFLGTTPRIPVAASCKTPSNPLVAASLASVLITKLVPFNETTAPGSAMCTARFRRRVDATAVHKGSTMEAMKGKDRIWIFQRISTLFWLSLSRVDVDVGLVFFENSTLLRWVCTANGNDNHPGSSILNTKSTLSSAAPAPCASPCESESPPRVDVEMIVSVMNGGKRNTLSFTPAKQTLRSRNSPVGTAGGSGNPPPLPQMNANHSARTDCGESVCLDVPGMVPRRVSKRGSARASVTVVAATPIVNSVTAW
mmetsp:Transcript_47313/g.56900  ORF Transcript_47313/g.56900 Transcript_47313/m.56900 type:complete len:304 (+) Transcript_47313:180-1091(+)